MTSPADAHGDYPLLSQQAMLQEETEHVSTLRGGGKDFIGLALSGGGIRSATFNLGILQALAKHDMLGHFDYLSTVSGGGYIGAWLSALIQRSESGIAGAKAVLYPAAQPREEAQPLRFLRRYSNYLTPRMGFSGDTLAATATFLRNFGLNLLPLLTLSTAFILVMYLLSQGAAMLDLHGRGINPMTLALVLIVAGVGCAAAGLATTSDTRFERLAASPGWAWSVLVPVGLAGNLMALAMVRGELSGLDRLDWIGLGTAAYGLAWTGGFGIWTWLSKDRELGISRMSDKLMLGPVTLLAGALAGLLTSLVAGLLAPVAPPGPIRVADAWYALTLGAPLIMMSFACAVALHIGLLRRILSHQAREWWSRLGGLLLAASLAWIAAFALTGLAPALLILVHGWSIEAGGAWAVITAAGVWLAKSPFSGGEGKNPWLDAVVRVTPYVFIVGFALLLSGSVYTLLSNHFCPGCQVVQPTLTQAVMSGCPPCIQDRIVAQDFSAITAGVFANLGRFDHALLLGALAGCIASFLLAGWRIDINLFSLHHFYRNRLVRAYLGASNFPGRRSHPFTGFCADDDIPLKALRNQRPFHILNTTLNLSGGDELAWQTRRAASFSFTPLHCGFEYRATNTRDGVEEESRPIGGYRSSARYMSGWGAYLGSAMSLSGAAASPLMGYHTSAPMAALMTVCNVRLGQWLGNPTDEEAWKANSPSFGNWYLLKELTASANTRARFLYLSDGGHFENLGIYELVRRRCALIVAVDAGCDPRHGFDDLANAIRKCRIDLAAEIDINVDDLLLGEDNGHSRRHRAAGLIHYDNGDLGALLYIKASLTGGEPPDILNYKANHKDFPHDTTADQCFDEDQFESYRALGLHIGDDLFGAIRDAATSVNGEFNSAAFIAQVLTMGSAPRSEFTGQ